MSVAPTFREALRFWLKLGCIGFGGPTGQIAILHTELVERKKWIGEERFLHALNFCMLLPGPEATQLATYCGWLLHGVRGGIAAGVLFVLPGAGVLWALSWIYAAHGNVPWIAAVFHGLKPAVTAIVAAAVIRIGRRTLRGPAAWALAAAAFAAIFYLRVPFPAIVAGAAAIGFFGPRWSGSASSRGAAETVVAPGGLGSGRATFQAALGLLLLWWAPVFAAAAWQGWEGMLARAGVFFSQAAMVTFGGAYSVLPYVAQEAVENQRWLTAAQMLDGLGLAETTPGPLILVVQYVGFLAGWSQPGGLSPLTMATLGAAMATWTTFVPAMLWIFLGAPFVERLRGNARLSGALSAVTAAVVGVVLNLAVWFGLQVFFPGGGLTRVDWFALAVGAGAFVALQRWQAGVVATVAASGAIGLAGYLIGRAGA